MILESEFCIVQNPCLSKSYTKFGLQDHPCFRILLAWDKYCTRVLAHTTGKSHNRKSTHRIPRAAAVLYSSITWCPQATYCCTVLASNPNHNSIPEHTYFCNYCPISSTMSQTQTEDNRSRDPHHRPSSTFLLKGFIPIGRYPKASRERTSTKSTTIAIE